ncbi:MAG: helix-turn-helix transcriptional regulator [Anaerolineales bacterium]|nr:helix-turn-helix transcriptional regulator [Anaerolineales bacterium]
MTDPNLPPLREPTFLILLSLAPGPMHGYAILKEVKRLSEGRVKMSTGTLYGAIERLLEQGWIQRVDDPLLNETNRERKAYELTELGHKALNVEIARLKKLVSLAQSRTAEGAS